MTRGHYSDRTASRAEGRLKRYDPRPNKRTSIPPHPLPEYVAYWLALEERTATAKKKASAGQGEGFQNTQKGIH